MSLTLRARIRKVGCNKTIKIGGHERLIGRQQVFPLEVIDGSADLRDLRSTPEDLLKPSALASVHDSPVQLRSSILQAWICADILNIARVTHAQHSCPITFRPRMGIRRRNMHALWPQT